MISPGESPVKLKKAPKARRPLVSTQLHGAKGEILSHISDEILQLPAYVSEISRLLSSVPVDLKRVGEIIRKQPKLSDYIIHLCELTMPGFRDQNANIEHGIVFLGIDQMRTLILACCMVLDIGSCYSSSQLRSFWRHSLLTACLSERLARSIDYPNSENACRAGLLHDAGALALVRWAADRCSTGELPNALCGETTRAERESFGTDHCFVGGLIGRAWGLPEQIVDVLECHHNPQASRCDRVLVGIVAAADSFCVGRGIQFQLVKERASVSSDDGFHRALCRYLPDLRNDVAREVVDVLQITYLQKMNDFENGYGSVFSGASRQG
jgi:putative nucleotidyltransferase with HDIG domain